MTAVLLLLQLASVGEVGGAMPPLEPSSEAARLAPRIHAGVHFTIAGAFSGAAPGVGPGVSTELGATFADRYAVSARLTVATIVVASVATVGLAFDVALSDRVSLGLAASIGLVGGIFIPDMPASLTAFAPVRVVFAPFPRAPHQAARTGLVVYAEAGPGYGLVMGEGFGGRIRAPDVPRPRLALHPLSVQVAIGVGYAWW